MVARLSFFQFHIQLCPLTSSCCYFADAFENLPQAPLPEIQRTNIAQVLLQLKVLGITSPAAFPFLSPPTDVSLRKALELLLMVDAIGKVCIF